MENLKIEMLPVDSLKPYEKNARAHEEYDVGVIANSIEQFGFNDPIGVWGEENLIVEGHGRLLAAKKLGMSEVPCVRLDHLSDEQRRAYAIAHNKSAEQSRWDFDFLKTELPDLMENFDMTDFGFGEFELTMLTDDAAPQAYEDEELDDYDDVSESALARKKIIITFEDQDEERLAKMLGLDSIDKVVYGIEELNGE